MASPRRRDPAAPASSPILWQKSDQGVAKVWVSKSVLVAIDTYRGERQASVVFRIDGRHLAREGYRVDRATMLGWEAIDGGRGPDSLADAKALALRYLDAARAERTLDPRTSRDPSPPSASAVGKAFLAGVEDAIWLPAWADAIEEQDGRTPKRITRETADPAPADVTRIARSFVAEVLRLNRANVLQLWARASEADGRPADPEDLGYYLTMQAIGHGIGWEDSHEPFDVQLPYIEVWAYRDDRWHVDASMTRGKRSRTIGSHMRRKWHGTA